MHDVKITWGTYSQIAVEMELFETASKNGKYRSSLNKYAKKFFRILERINFEIQKITGVTRRRKASLPPIKYASNWVSLNDAAVRYLVSQKDFIYRTFQHAFLCDELFVPTVLLNNARFQDTVYHPETLHDRPDELQGNLRYIDWWEDGSPYTWTSDDWDKVEYGRDLGHLFSRKFNNNIDCIIKKRLDKL